MVEVGSVHRVQITGVSHQGYGVGRIGELVVFVPQALLEETVAVEITAVKKSLAEGRLAEVLIPSPERVAPACGQSQQCGGCELQHSTYAYQLRVKGQMVQETLSRIGHLEVPVPPALGMAEPWHYRNKGVFHVDYSQGRVRLGFYQQGSHELVPAENCLLFSPVVNQLTAWLTEAILMTGKAHYIQKVMIRESKANGQLMVVFVTADNAWRLPALTQRLLAEQPLVASVYHNINTNPKVMLGRNFTLLAGEPYLTDTISPLHFRISPQSFFQVNNQQAAVLYQQALSMAALTGQEQVVDAYCGIGTIALYLASQAAQVYGVESVAQAVKDAKDNARANNVANCHFYAAKAEEWLPKWLKAGNHADVVVVDPPRKGCDQRLLDAVIQSGAEKVIYVSCNPATLARDAAYLVSNGYGIGQVQPVDMFPGSWHCEVCVELCRKERSA